MLLEQFDLFWFSLGARYRLKDFGLKRMGWQFAHDFQLVITRLRSRRQCFQNGRQLKSRGECFHFHHTSQDVDLG